MLWYLFFIVSSFLLAQLATHKKSFKFHGGFSFFYIWLFLLLLITLWLINIYWNNCVNNKTIKTTTIEKMMRHLLFIIFSSPMFLKFHLFLLISFNNNNNNNKIRIMKTKWKEKNINSRINGEKYKVKQSNCFLLIIFFCLFFLFISQHLCANFVRKINK